MNTISKRYFKQRSILNNAKDKSEENKQFDNTDWKNFLKLGFEIKNSWKNIEFLNEEIAAEIIPLRNEIFSSLKGKIFNKLFRLFQSKFIKNNIFIFRVLLITKTEKRKSLRGE